MSKERIKIAPYPLITKVLITYCGMHFEGNSYCKEIAIKEAFGYERAIIIKELSEVKFTFMDNGSNRVETLTRQQICFILNFFKKTKQYFPYVDTTVIYDQGYFNILNCSKISDIHFIISVIRQAVILAHLNPEISKKYHFKILLYGKKDFIDTFLKVNISDERVPKQFYLYNISDSYTIADCISPNEYKTSQGRFVYGFFDVAMR